MIVSGDKLQSGGFIFAEGFKFKWLVGTQGSTQVIPLVHTLVHFLHSDLQSASTSNSCFSIYPLVGPELGLPNIQRRQRKIRVLPTFSLWHPTCEEVKHKPGVERGFASATQVKTDEAREAVKLSSLAVARVAASTLIRLVLGWSEFLTQPQVKTDEGFQPRSGRRSLKRRPRRG